MTKTQNAADAFTAATVEIVTKTGCTVDQAISYFMGKLITEQPDMAAKVLRAWMHKVSA